VKGHNGGGFTNEEDGVAQITALRISLIFP